MKVLIIVVIVVVVLVLLGLAMAARIIKQYEQGVLFRLGRVLGPRAPGFRLIIPFADVVRRVSLRIVMMPIQSQGIITRDNVSVDVSAIACYRVTDAVKSVIAIEDVKSAIDQIAQALGAAALGDASDIMTAHPLALQLRNLQSLVEIGVGKNTTVVFPGPLMTTIAELGSFLAREQAAAAPVLPAASDGNRTPVTAANGTSPNGTAGAHVTTRCPSLFPEPVLNQGVRTL